MSAILSINADIQFLKPTSGIPVIQRNMKSTFFAAIILAFSSISAVQARPAETSDALNSPQSKPRDVLSLDSRDPDSIFADLLPKDIEESVAPTIQDRSNNYAADVDGIEKRESAGLFWGPKEIGNLKLYLTKPHMGWAGPKFPNANHVNFHVDKKSSRPGKWDSVVNLHIVKYTHGGKGFCLYAYDSVTKKVVFDNCFDSFGPAIAKCVSAIKDFVDTLLRNADWIASIIIIGALVVALASCLTGLAVVAV
jgi:hypothetical protein